MTRLRFTLAQLIAFVLFIGFGFAALRNADGLWASAAFSSASSSRSRWPSPAPGPGRRRRECPGPDSPSPGRPPLRGLAFNIFDRRLPKRAALSPSLQARTVCQSGGLGRGSVVNCLYASIPFVGCDSSRLLRGGHGPSPCPAKDE